MTPRPERPLTSDDHAVSLSLPTGVTTPRPVKSGWRMFLSVLDGVAGGAGGWMFARFCLPVDRGGVGERHRQPVQSGLVVGGDRGGIGGNPFDEAGQDLAGADLDEGGDTAVPHRLDRAD